MLSTGPDSDTAVGDIVIVSVNSEGPYGVIFEPDQDGCAAVIQAWERLPNGKFGELQKHGGLHHNDVLIAVNDVTLDCVPHNEVMRIVNDRNLLKKAFKFMNSTEYYRRKKATGGGIGLTLQNDSKNCFLSIIRRARISQSSSNSKFVEYEVACQWRVASMRLQKEIVYKWSVWKRFSEYTVLHNLLKKSLGWQMQSIEMPSEHTFVMNKLSPEFIEQRKEDLNVYWQKIITIDKAAEFSKHHCSQDLKSFLQVDETVRNQKNGYSNNDDEDDNGKEDDNNNKAMRRGSTGAIRAPPRSLASRRRSSNANSGSGGFGMENATVPAAVNQTSIPTNTLQTSVPSTNHQPISTTQTTNTSQATKPPPPPPPPPPQIAKPEPPQQAKPEPPPQAKPEPPPQAKPEPPPQAIAKPAGARVNLLADIAKRRIE